MKKLKFLLGAIAVFALASTFSPSRAQTRIYLNETFDTPLNNLIWNLSACTNITEEEGPLYYLRLSETDYYGGWVYDPNGEVVSGGMPTPLNGEYWLISNPITLESDAVNIVQVDFMYGTTYIGHNFSICVRESGQTKWDTISSINPNSFGGESIIGVLDAKWGGKTVEMGFCFSTQFYSGYAYYFLMGALKFSAYERVPKLATEVISAPFAYGQSLELKMQVSNVGPIGVENVEYMYTMDAQAEETSFTVTFASTLDALVGIQQTSAQIDMESLAFGNHTLKLRPVKVNGEAYEGETIEFDFTYLDESKLTQAYVPVFESFTSSTCGPCASANTALNPVQEELREAGSLNVIKYQMNWPGNGDPYYISGNQTRMAFYDGIFGWNGSWSVPMPIYNGSDVITEWPGTYWSDLANELKKRVAEDHAQKAVMEIHITNASISDTKRLTLEFEVTSPIDVEANVIAVIAEHTTTGNRRTNGEKEFHHVALDFPTGAQGVTKNFEAGKKETFSYAVAMSRTNMEGLDLEVLCFVQHKSGYIFQSSSIIEGGNVANEEEMLGDIRVYPNPARENTTISGLESANVAVFDMTGRQVYMQNGVDGNLELSLSGFAEGTYVIRIVEGGKIAHRKLIVVR